MTARRNFVGLLAAGLLLSPATVRAQAARKIRRIGILSQNPQPSDAEFQMFWAPMRQLGWVEGATIVLERRFTGEVDLLPAAAEELVRLNVEVIIANGTMAVLAAKAATTTIPIVMASAGDPVALGLVASLAHPSGNITGYSTITPEIVTKRASLVHELLPAATRVMALVAPTAASVMVKRTQSEMEATYRSFGIQVDFIEIDSPNYRFEDVPAEAVRRQAQALEVHWWLQGTPFEPTMDKAIRYRLPTIVLNRKMVEAGALMYFGLNTDDVDQRTAAMIDKILRGAKPAEIPVEQPSRFEIVINMKTAKALGITVPKSLLLRADEVIQ